ncbi:MAG: ABC transporter permease [Eubacteriales bacterium]|nr:ABC transporter permease [Eubacteriales bacterium]
MAGKSGREINATPQNSLKKKILSWEGGLVLIFIGVLIFGSVVSPSYTFTNVLREMPKYLAELFMMFAMGFILVIGEIDISVGAIVCLSATLTCFINRAGAPMVVQVIACLLIGLACGCLNGIIATNFTELPTMIITLGTQIIFRGIAEVSMGSGGSIALTDTAGFAKIGGRIGPFPIAFFLIILTAVIYIFVLSRTTFGRKLYAVGSNKTAALYAGIPVQRIRWICMTLIGLMAGICALFMLATTFGANTTTGQGFEMDVIAMCVFGGIATTGGKGNLVGATLAGFTIVCLRIALGQLNMSGQTILVIIGILLIASALIPGISQSISNKKKRAAV